MRSSIFWKFIIAYCVFALLGFVTIGYLTTGKTYSHLLNQYVNSYYASASTIAANISENDDYNADNIDSIVQNFNKSIGATIWIVDNNGNIIHSSDKDNSITSISGFDASSLENSSHIVSRFFDTFSHSHLVVYVPINNTTLNGFVMLYVPNAKIVNETSLTVNIFYYTYFLILLFSLIIIFVFTVNFYKPMRIINKATMEYANGNFDYPLNFHSEDELGVLASSLKYMANRLHDADEYQKKFVSDISHDFRSPLTSIKGYVEAIIDGTIPHENQNKYLHIVLTEAERLERLTNGLIELNTGGGKNPGLRIEAFNIDEVISSILDTLEGRCKKKNLTIDYNYGDKHFVSADKDRIQQVLHNLIDNAIKFSNHSSTIKIKLYNKGDKVFFSIKDNGIGISKSELSRIWVRFYKTDASRGKDKTGSGIGLAIVKDIINAHNQTIDVISTEGVGTEFIFSLQKAKKSNS